jgi:type I restriction enzyme, S subunit
MNQELKPYPEYKESGVSWLGNVPSHWKLLPNRAIFQEIIDKNHPKEQMLSVTITRGIIQQKTLLENSSKKDSSNQNKSAYKLVLPNDVAYNKMRAWQGAIATSEFRGIISPAYVVVRLRENDNPSYYFHHLFRTIHFAKEAERWSYGITSDMWSLRSEHFKMIYSVCPPPDEQSAIVRYLDHANRRIEKAIRAKRKLIVLLNEQRQVIIHQAVTKGLDPNVAMKDSGVPWLGEIPAHWDTWRISRFARVGNGSTPSRAKPAYWNGGTYPWLNSSQTNRGFIDSADQFVTPTALRECHLPKVPAGSLLVAITGQGKTRGTASVLSIEATINQHVAYITPRKSIVSTEFLHLIFIAAYKVLRAESDDSGSTKGAITCEDLKRFKLALPPMSEQNNLVEFIRSQTQALSGTIQRTTREIELLQEYRTRLIADVVTGKLDVRDAVAGLPDTEEIADEALLEDEELLEGDETDMAEEETSE